MERVKSFSTSTTTSSCSSSSSKTLLVAYRSLGVVYGGLATSPLYLYPSINMVDASSQDYLGILSIVFWTLALVGVLKYALLVLRADHHGEGGTFVLYSLVGQHANMAKLGHIFDSTTVDQPAVPSSPSLLSSSRARSRVIKYLENSGVAQGILFLVTLLASVMLIVDGVLTPAISVLSAMSGLQNASPSITQDAVVWITVVILVGLFLLQSFGTERVSILFSPLMLAWLVSNLFIGAFNIAVHYPTVFKALSPSYAFSYFLRHGKHGWLSLSGTCLCISGVEAMYADLGHFNRRAIQVGFLVGVLPSNVITYAGQTAFFLKHPTACNEHAYYNVIPKPLLWPMLIIGTLAAIVASQSLISACFSLVKQCMEMDHFPRVSMIHTSNTKEGQVYSPQLNYFLLVLCLGIVLGFRSGSSLGSAYGVTVTMVVFLTTLLFTLVLLVVWGASLAATLGYISFFGVLEGSYLIAVLSGMPHGGWLPFAISIAVALLMLTWIYGRMKKHEYESSKQMKTDEFAAFLSSSAAADIQRVPGMSLVYTATPNVIPSFFLQHIRSTGAFHNLLVLLTLRKDQSRPLVMEAGHRFVFGPGHGQGQGHTPGVYTCVARYGFAEALDWKEVWNEIAESLERYIRECRPATADRSNVEEGYSTGQELQELSKSKREGGPAHVIGRTVLVASSQGRWRAINQVLIDTMYRFLHSNCPSSLPFLNSPHPHQVPSNLVEIGTLALV